MQNLIPRDGEVTYQPNFIPKAQADACWGELLETTPWELKAINLFGRSVTQPRRVCWVSGGATLRYSGVTMTPNPWTNCLLRLKQVCEAATGQSFNGVLMNHYRDGRDHMGWHSDDEKELGDDPVIASLSFGASRTFKLKHRTHRDLVRDIELSHGSLLVMAGTCQRHWQHSLPRRLRVVEGRINLTFRHILGFD